VWTWRYFIRAAELLFIGRPAPEKGLHDLLAALSSLRHLPWSLSVVGETPPNALASPFDRVRRRGAMSHAMIPDVMRDHDVLVVPSHYETFGNVALEGLASGMIVVAARTGGLKALIHDGRTGVHFVPGDVADLRRALSFVIEAGSSLDRMRVEARAEAMNYSWPAVADATASLLTSILS